ncbi:MAG: (S)-phenoxypropionate/alpha-ketoglutarate-dioxygenase [Alphaproteobacteria bacterium MarineAlpha11_Bin1]|nr:MAG: (S)-phenoxypropionate/alpha-ketoglutarate-dioxygenase [Alphaproteobacteria bacterium MarineAlpha11_Bin1]|tara:strand:- start:33241 stop:34080 length:840 start_codon:yes stop_codon:yes gene_type:complete
MSISVEPLTPTLGARITGVDLSGVLNDTTMNEIRQAWLDYFVVVIPGQDLSSDDQIAFTEWFGPRQEVRTVKVVEEGPQNFMYVANKSVDGMDGVLPDGEMQFHTDQCYYETPSRATILFALEIPTEGGNTRFANSYRAYDALDVDIKERLKGLKAHNVYDYDANATIKANESAPDAPRYEHPVVIQHPETGREVLYVNRLMTDHIVGVDRGESDKLLAYLFKKLEDPAYCYEHVWTAGDLVMWDNLCTLHARTWFDPSLTRVLRRTTVAGEAPTAALC